MSSDTGDSEIDNFYADSPSEYEPDTDCSETDDLNSTLELVNSDSQDDDQPKRKAKPKKTPKPRVKNNIAKPKNDDSSSGPSTSIDAGKKRKGLDQNDGSSKKPKVVKVKVFKKKPEKPFNLLFEGVVFTISGFQNPLRSEIRSKALALGAKYRGDWDNTCTHLICAFTNTPKYHQVRGHGKIVKKEWIEDSYSKRIAFPWRRYALDPADIGQPESDEEIYEKVDRPDPVDNRRRVNSSSSEDTEDEIERVRQAKGIKPKPAVPTNIPPAPVAPQPTVYDADTEEEDNVEEKDVPDNLPSIPDLFDNIKFLILDDLDLDERAKLKRYIIAHKGSVADDSTNLNEVEYAITCSSEAISEVKEEFPQIAGVRPDWIWISHDQDRLIPPSKYEI